MWISCCYVTDVQSKFTLNTNAVVLVQLNHIATYGLVQHYNELRFFVTVYNKQLVYCHLKFFSLNFFYECLKKEISCEPNG